MSNKSGSPALAVSKNGAKTNEITLDNGVKVRIVPVSAALLEATTRSIPTPKPPMFLDEATGRDLPNTMHPDYVAALEKTSHDRNLAAMDTLVMFGIELVDGMPEDDGWLKKLRYLQDKLGHDFGLEGFDLSDEMDREYVYKRFVLANGEILEAVTSASGLSSEEIKEAEATF